MNNEEIKAQQPHISPADANTVLAVRAGLLTIKLK